MVTDAKWQSKAKGLLKAELKRRDVSYKQLADKLEKFGIQETPENIANKISRGGFSAVFLLQCLEAIDCKSIQIGLE